MSDFVSFLAAAVLYVVSVGKVQGFAFTLGLTTLLDVVVVFLFTKPLMTHPGPHQVLRAGPHVVRPRPERLGATRRTAFTPAPSGRRATPGTAGTATSTATSTVKEA